MGCTCGLASGIGGPVGACRIHNQVEWQSERDEAARLARIESLRPRMAQREREHEQLREVAELNSALTAEVERDGSELAARDEHSRRRAGRPGWTAALFDERWQEAESQVTTAPPHRIAEVAAAFRGLQGEGGIDSEHLRRLRRRRERGELPVA